MVACIALAGCGESEPRDENGCRRFCVSVTPTRGDTETVFRFSGRDWIPRREVTATYGVYCAPRRVCILVAKQTRFRTDSRGDFTFRFRNGPEALTQGPRPRGSGGGPVSFRQRTRARPTGSFVSRTPRYFVDGRRIGGPRDPDPDGHTRPPGP